MGNHRSPFELDSEEQLVTDVDNSSFDQENPFSTITISPGSRVKQVWAIGGGKGGIGKSLVASSLAISLSRMGNKVTAIDLDLGGANLHTAVGINPPKQTLNDFLTKRVNRLQDCAVGTSIPNLNVISGAQDSVNATDIESKQKVGLLQELRELDADYVVLDLGAGTSQNTLDFFIYSDVGVITLLPEPTSIENAYRFIKSAYFRKLLLCPDLAQVKPLIEFATDSKNPMGIKTPSDLYDEISKADPEAAVALKNEIQKFKPKLVINQARTQTDVDIGFSIKSVCRKYFGIDMDYVGCLDYESAVWQAVRKKRPLMLEFPNSKLVSSIEKITRYIVKRHGHTRTDFY